MKTEFKDVAHLYLGCELRIGDADTRYFSKMVSEFSICTGTNEKQIQIWWKSKECKPILRPLSDIKEMEIIHLFSIIYKSIYGHSCDFEQNQFLVENENSVGLIGIDRLNDARIGFTVEKQRGVEISMDSDKLMVDQFIMTKELLRNGFDLFDLTKSGQAIDKTTII